MPSSSEIKRELAEIEKSPLFRQAPKLRKLLEYVCNKVALHEGANLSEYTIALDVFGKGLNFKESKDATVRVEISRLRKRLIQYYETDGRDRPFRISVPQRTYAPEFVFADEPLVEVESETLPPSHEVVTEPIAPLIAASSIEPITTAPAISTAPAALPAEQRRWTWRPWTALGLILLFLGVIASLLWRQQTGLQAKSKPVQTARVLQNPVPGTQRGPTQDDPIIAPANPQPVRILSGYNGPPRRDLSGAVWGPDRFFTGGRPYQYNIPRVGRTNDPQRYQHARIGELSYEIPVAPGIYELHLYFVEPEYGPEVGRGESDRTFYLHIDDRRLEPMIDIESEAMGPNIADERVFKDVKPEADGKIHLAWESANGVPLVSAIELLPGLPHKQLPVRLVTQRLPFTDHLGQVWKPDDYYWNGQTVPRDSTVSGTADPAMFRVERYGHFNYAIPVDVHGTYSVSLHMAELYFGSSSLGAGGAGSRVFDITCNGLMLFENVDLFREAGFAKAVVKTASHIKATAQGKLNVEFQPVVNYGVISGIEVVDETR